MGSLGEDSDEEVLYHQLATEETEEEVRGKKKKIFRPRLNRNTIMELSIHNRRLFFPLLACCRGVWNLGSYSHSSLGDQHQGWSGLCREHGHPVQLAPHPHDLVSHLSLRQWCLDLPGHPSQERRPQAKAEARPRWHHDHRLCPHGHWPSGSL